MTKKEFTASIGKLTGYKDKEVNNLLDSFAVVLGEALQSGKKVTLPGLGHFSTVLEEEKIDTDPSDGKKYIYPPKVNIFFKAANSLVSKLFNNKSGDVASE